MAGLITDPSGNLRVQFRVPGIDQLIRESVGLKATKENLAFVRRTIVRPLEQEIAARDYAAILRRWPNSPRLASLKPVVPGGGLTINGLLDLVIRDYEQNDRATVVKVQSAHKHLRAFFGSLLAVECSAAQVAAYKAHRIGAGAANATINREFAGLRRGFVLADLPAPRFENLKENNVRKGFFEREQLERVLEHLSDDLRPVALTLYISGWRKSEVLSRQRHHVDPAGWLRLEPGETKNGDGRMFPLIPELLEVLEAQMGRTRELELQTGRIIPWLFHRNGAPIIAFDKAWHSACQAAGVPDRLVHDFRRTAVRNLERAGVSQSVAMKMTGHRTASVYRRYAIVEEQNLIEAGKKMSALLTGDRGNVVPLKVVR